MFKDSPRGEADGQSFIFPTINETSNKNNNGNITRITLDFEGDVRDELDTIDASIHSSLNNLQDDDQQNLYCYCGSLHAGDSGIDSVQASPSPNAIALFPTEQMEAVTRGESIAIATSSDARTTSTKDATVALEETSISIGEATPLLSSGANESVQGAKETNIEKNKTTTTTTIIDIISQEHEFKTAEAIKIPKLKRKPIKMGQGNSISTNDLNYHCKSSALLHPDHARLFAMRTATKHQPYKGAMFFERSHTSPDEPIRTLDDAVDFPPNDLALSLVCANSASSSTTSSLTSVAAISLGGVNPYVPSQRPSSSCSSSAAAVIMTSTTALKTTPLNNYHHYTYNHSNHHHNHHNHHNHRHHHHHHHHRHQHHHHQQQQLNMDYNNTNNQYRLISDQQRVSDPWLQSQSDRDNCQQNECNARRSRSRRSSSVTGRYSVFDALDLEYALLRAAARGSVGPYSLSESIHKLTFTQSLAFPALARGLATKRRRSATRLNERPLNPNESGLNTCAKAVTALILVAISFMVFLIVYKFVRT